MHPRTQPGNFSERLRTSLKFKFLCELRDSHLLHHPKSLGCTSADKMLQAFFKMSRCRRR
jgi:hypothetical protein